MDQLPSGLWVPEKVAAHVFWKKKMRASSKFHRQHLAWMVEVGTSPIGPRAKSRQYRFEKKYRKNTRKSYVKLRNAYWLPKHLRSAWKWCLSTVDNRPQDASILWMMVPDCEDSSASNVFPVDLREDFLKVMAKDGMTQWPWPPAMWIWHIEHGIFKGTQYPYSQRD